MVYLPYYSKKMIPFKEYLFDVRKKKNTIITKNLKQVINTIKPNIINELTENAYICRAKERVECKNDNIAILPKFLQLFQNPLNEIGQ